MLSREFLTFCRKHIAVLEAQLDRIPLERRPPQRTMRAVAERLRLLNQDAAHDLVMARRDAWWPAAQGRRPPEVGDVIELTVTDQGPSGALYVRAPTDGFYGAIAGDVILLRVGADVGQLSRRHEPATG